MIEPTPGRIVLFKIDKDGVPPHDLPAIITMTEKSFPTEGSAEAMADLPDAPSGSMNVHLAVMGPFSPERIGYTELDVSYDGTGAPNTWRWPVIS